MWLFPVKNKTKINHINKRSIRSVLRQKYFLEVIQSDTSKYILTLDTNTGGQDSFWIILSNFTSTQYPNLPLFLSVDKHFWSSQGYHLQFMSHMEEEATMMMHNIIPVLTFKNGDDMKN